MQKAIHRIFDYLKRNDIKPAQLERQAGLSNGYLQKQLKREADLGEGIIMKIVENCPELTLDNLLTDSKEVNHMMMNEPVAVYSKSPGSGVPYYDVDFLGGFDLVFDDDTINPSYFIDFPPFNDADCWVNVTGKSMSPFISHGDLVALKRMKSWDNFLLFGEIYAVITEEYRTIKIVAAGEDPEHYTLVPYSKSQEFSKQPIPKNIITHIFQVKGSIKKFF